MKHKMFSLILALTIASWAQTATPRSPSTAQQSTEPAGNAKSCDKMAPADAKDAAACCAHHDMNSMDSKEKASCCGGKNASAKDATSCMRKGKDKTAASCCKDGCSKDGCGKDGCGKDGCAKDKTACACCGGKDGKGSCSGKKMEKTAKSCCKEELHS